MLLTNIPATVYPDFDQSHLEQLTLAMIRKMLAHQQTSNLAKPLITASTTEDGNSTTIKCVFKVTLNVSLRVINPFPDLAFTQSSNAPNPKWAGENLAEAVTWLLIYQNTLEKNPTINSGDSSYISFNITDSEEGINEHDLTIDLTEYPLIISYNENGYISSAKPYLNGLAA